MAIIVDIGAYRKPDISFLRSNVPHGPARAYSFEDCKKVLEEAPYDMTPKQYMQLLESSDTLGEAIENVKRARR